MKFALGVVVIVLRSVLVRSGYFARMGMIGFGRKFAQHLVLFFVRDFGSDDLRELFGGRDDAPPPQGPGCFPGGKIFRKYRHLLFYDYISVFVFVVKAVPVLIRDCKGTVLRITSSKNASPSLAFTTAEDVSDSPSQRHWNHAFLRYFWCCSSP